MNDISWMLMDDEEGNDWLDKHEIAGEISVMDFDWENLSATVYTEDASGWELDGLKVDETHIERFESTHTASIEIYRRTA